MLFRLLRESYQNYTALLSSHWCELGCATVCFFRYVYISVLSWNQQSPFEVSLLVFPVYQYVSHSVDIVSGLRLDSLWMKLNWQACSKNALDLLQLLEQMKYMDWNSVHGPSLELARCNTTQNAYHVASRSSAPDVSLHKSTSCCW